MKNNIKVLREQKNLTQQECAKIFNVKLRAWQTYEQGISEPKFEILCKIADYFNVSLDYLLGRTTVKYTATEQPDPFAGIDISAVEKRIIERYTALDENMRAISIELFKQLSAALDSTPMKQRHVERLGDIEDELRQEEEAKRKGVI